MEIRVVLRGLLAGLLAGVLAFGFSWIFAEPVIDRAIDYESGRDDVLNALNQAAGRPVGEDGPEIVSRSVQSTAGILTGLVVFAVAMAALVAVAYVVLHGRLRVRPRNLVWMIAAFGFLGVFALPFVKYPANPPAIGHEFTIVQRGHLYLILVACSVVLLAAAVFAAVRLRRLFGPVTSVLVAGVGFLVLFGVVIGLLPSLGELSANTSATNQFGYARSATETPSAITNILSRPLTVDGRTYAPGQIVYPGFSADDLWKFRWYALLNQLLMWTTIALALGALVERLVGTGARSASVVRPDSVELGV